MIRLEYHILAALVLDGLAGDPRWLPHPVKLIGRFAMALETPARRLFRNARLAGIATALTVIVTSGAAACGLVKLAHVLHPLVGDVVSILLIYTCIAARDLAGHAMAVYRELDAGDLPEARRRVAMMVGRDTDGLDEAGVTRAAVESVAENLVDGVTAPLLFAIFFGPVGAIVYKAVNTLDSTFGYKNDAYLKFGWASAKIDDVANFVPSRLTAPLIAASAALLGQRPANALRVLARDCRNHTSPNSGYAEAAVAGALGVQFGGRNHYFGRPVDKPTIGDAHVELDRTHIRKTNALMYVTTALFAALCIGARALALHLWHMGGDVA
jgi:adenosylcobinamide-phosphate synthase